MKSAYRPLVPGHRILPFNSSQALDAVGPRTAAVLVEVIQAESGYVPADFAWLRALEARCRAAGALLIVDEIQTGFGRSGDGLDGFEGQQLWVTWACADQGDMRLRILCMRHATIVSQA